jgi:predicted PurR-regulated permease PerM
MEIGNGKDRGLVGQLLLWTMALAALRLSYLVLKPLVNTLLAAGFLAIVSRPIHRRALVLARGREGRAALLSTTAAALLIVLPMLAILGLLAMETVDVYNQASDFIQTGGVGRILGSETARDLRGRLERYAAALGIDPASLRGKGIQELQELSGQMVSLGRKVVSNVFRTVGLFFIFLFALFFFYRDGEAIHRYAVRIIPLPDHQSARLLRQFTDVTRASLLGSFGVAAIQGILGGAALAMVGYQGLFWGVIMVFSSLVPAVGAALVWAPASVVLFAGERWVAGTFLALWGILVVGTADNLARPFLMQRTGGLHPLLILVAILGGVQFFGMIGIILGPLVLTLTLTLLEMIGEDSPPADGPGEGSLATPGS